MHEGCVTYTTVPSPHARVIRLRHEGVMSCVPLRICIQVSHPSRLNAHDSRRSVTGARWIDRKGGRLASSIRHARCTAADPPLTFPQVGVDVGGSL